jgi:glycosyltransferase involved in cell wall biosynthesis
MITFCIPSKNNLRYLKTCVPSIQLNSHYTTNEVLVFVDQDNDGTVEWLEENNIRYILNTESECKGIGYAYDTMFKEAKFDLVVAFHADMILGIDADLYLMNHYKPQSVVCSTRIEPPLHPPGPEKIVQDFGLWPEEIKWDDFNQFVVKTSKENETKTTKSSFAPWLINRNDHLGHDPIFLSVFEDADLFRRFKLAGYETIQVWSSLVYHLTCRGGQFEHANETKDFQVKSEAWQYKNQVSLLEYIRKWGGMFKEYGPCEPRPNRKYNIGIQIKNCDLSILNTEPYFDNMSVDCDYKPYVDHMQPLSKFDLTSKFTKTLNNDIVVEFDLQLGNTEELNYIIANIEDIMDQITETGNYEFGTVKLNINNIQVCNPKIKLI